jgi:hypothetical protein
MGLVFHSITPTIPAASGESNAGPQPLPEAGAQRRLEAVGSMRLFGPYAAAHWTQYGMGRGKGIKDLYGNRLPLLSEHGYWITIADALVLHCS